MSGNDISEIAVISGKGGTGKTTITASFASLAQNLLLADCDVDASNLHLILDPTVEKTEEFSGSQVAVKEPGCIECGKCEEVCRFDAVTDDYEIDELKCEGCGTCVYACPVDVLKLKEIVTGEVYESRTRYGPMVHAKLGIGEEASGKLVTKVKDSSRRKAKEMGKELILIDGSPGIGCPVIASISGADLVVLVTEPTLSGIHDLERVYQMAEHFDIHTCVVVNKYDLNPDITGRIREFCEVNSITLAAELPYDKMVTEAMIQGKSIVEFDDAEGSEIHDSIVSLWDRVLDKLDELKDQDE
ncbi:MAG: ATP-binding protein [Candidatus Saliniplasma sp.]